VNQQMAHRLITAYVDGWKNNNAAQVLSTLDSECLKHILSTFSL